jgi:DNA-binding transcriptional ArsR family regulator
MSRPHEYLQDPERLSAVRLAGADAVFDRWARAAAQVLDAPAGLVTLVGGDGVALAGKWVAEDPLDGGRTIPLSHSLCAFVVQDRAPLVVADARADERLRGNGAVRSLGVVSYLGVPVRAAGHVLGALCVLGTEPRAWTAAELDLLGGLAEAVVGEMERGLPGDAPPPRLGPAAWDGDVLERLSGRFHALGDATRLRILRTLGEGEHTVGEVAAAVDIAQPSATKHLQLLLAHGLVARRRDGARTRYRVVDHAVVRICDTMLGWVATDAPAC